MGTEEGKAKAKAAMREIVHETYNAEVAVLRASAAYTLAPKMECQKRDAASLREGIPLTSVPKEAKTEAELRRHAAKV